MSKGWGMIYTAPVGATLGRPWILFEQNPPPQGGKYGYVPSENPKNYVFRRASEARPYILYRQLRLFGVDGFGGASVLSDPALRCSYSIRREDVGSGKICPSRSNFPDGSSRAPTPTECDFICRGDSRIARRFSNSIRRTPPYNGFPKKFRIPYAERILATNREGPKNVIRPPGHQNALAPATGRATSREGPMALFARQAIRTNWLRPLAGGNLCLLFWGNCGTLSLSFEQTEELL